LRKGNTTIHVTINILPHAPQQMCITFYAQPICGCPPYPCHPHYALCPIAKARFAEQQQAAMMMGGGGGGGARFRFMIQPRACEKRVARVCPTGKECGICYRARRDRREREKSEGRRRAVVGEWERARAREWGRLGRGW